jgi:hypothetical protein
MEHTHNTLVDTVRGSGNWLESNATAAEQSGGAPSSFDSDGFTLTSWGQVNLNSSTLSAGAGMLATAQ